MRHSLTVSYSAPRSQHPNKISLVAA